jgi:DedD protein
MALVVFVPMILDNEPRPSRSQPSLAIPSKENAPPLPAPVPAAVTTPTPTPAPAPPPRVAQSAPAAPPSASGEVVVPPKAPASASSRAPQSGDGPGSAPAGTDRQASRSVPHQGFAVQVGAFREEDRLKQARAKLESAHIPHYTERVDASGGAITRLRAGPFPTREAADAARAKLNEGQVVALP